ncbi:MAG: VCBS repeat-containing protein, partial [Verrucomicrobiota bacterium]
MKPLQHHDARMLCQAMLLFLFILSLRSATIDWVQRNGYRDRQVAVPGPESRPGFVLLPMAETGLAFTNQLSDLLALNNQILENGAGLAIGDVDGDGWCDLYLCGAENDNKLFRNLGQWKFEEVTKAAGVGCPGQFSTGAVFADTDGDGDLDLLVNGLGVGTRLFLNDGRGQFREDTSSGLKRTGAATSLALADFEGDGDLDLYVTNYRVSSARSDPTPPKLTARVVDGKVMVSPEDRFTGFLRTDGQIEVVEKGEPDVFYLNNGQGKFAPVGWTTGTFLEADGKPVKAPPEDWGLSVLFRDLNGDDKPDLYICNDFAHSPDRFWLNTGQGQFRAIDPLAWRNMPLSSMAADVADINRDGHDDLFVVEMLSRNHRTRQHQRANVLKAELNLPFGEPAFRPEVLRNTLQLSRGDGTFAEIAWLAGLAASDWSWSTAFLDVDLDGWEDILVVTGNAHDVLDIDAQNELDRPPPGNTKRGLEFYPRLEQPNLVFRNRGNLTFEDKSDAWRFNATGVSQTLGLGDFDRDGDLDVIVGNLNREVWVYRNDCPAPRIAVRLKGRPPNTAGIGARILVTGGPIMQSQTIQSGGRYLSGDEALRTFAAGSGERFEIEVRWPRGQRSVVKDAPPNHIYEIEEPSPAAGPSESVTSTQPGLNSASRQQPLPRWFEDLSAKLNHAHKDEAFDDFARQPLLPNKVSQLGPGITWFDLNDDGWDDLVVPAGRTGQLAVFQNNGDGHFKRMDWPMFNPPLARDQTTVLGWRKGPG